MACLNWAALVDACCFLYQRDDERPVCVTDPYILKRKPEPFMRDYNIITKDFTHSCIIRAGYRTKNGSYSVLNGIAYMPKRLKLPGLPTEYVQ